MPLSDGRMRIIHQEDGFVVVAKASGLLSVPGKGDENQDCVAARVLRLFPQAPPQPSVHRLDRDTSGLLVLALDKDCHRLLSLQFQARLVHKRYEALLDGLLPLEPAEGLLRLPFRLDVANRPHQIYDEVHGKLGITSWRHLGHEGTYTRISFLPLTGRTHQLRVHSAHAKGLGLPIVGDPLYGSGSGAGELKLHAAELGFTHPRSAVPLLFTLPPPF